MMRNAKANSSVPQNRMASFILPITCGKTAIVIRICLSELSKNYSPNIRIKYGNI